MAQNDFVPTSWNGETITTDKLNQMCNNTQYLYDRSPRIRYATSGLTRDTGLKLLAGKTPYGPVNADHTTVSIYFGTFFSAGCRPVVTAVVGDSTSGLRKFCTVLGFNGEIDNTGFMAHVSSHEPSWANQVIYSGGWIHWTAVGY
jgi:hypothetical protein